MKRDQEGMDINWLDNLFLILTHWVSHVTRTWMDLTESITKFTTRPITADPNVHVTRFSANAPTVIISTQLNQAMPPKTTLFNNVELLLWCTTLSNICIKNLSTNMPKFKILIYTKNLYRFSQLDWLRMFIWKIIHFIQIK